MDALRKAAEQTLEAWSQRDYEIGKYMDTLRDALAQQAEPVQEPVAWMVYTEGGTSAYVTDNPHDLVGAYRALPLYTDPPQRKPLTEEEIYEMYSEPSSDAEMVEFARAIERAHGIGGDDEQA